MDNTYRSDLEAAIVRNDVLARENNELRKRVAHARRGYTLGFVGWSLVTLILLCAVALGFLLATPT